MQHKPCRSCDCVQRGQACRPSVSLLQSVNSVCWHKCIVYLALHLPNVFDQETKSQSNQYSDPELCPCSKSCFDFSFRRTIGIPCTAAFSTTRCAAIRAWSQTLVRNQSIKREITLLSWNIKTKLLVGLQVISKVHQATSN